jgi:hypothetical protein
MTWLLIGIAWLLISFAALIVAGYRHGRTIYMRGLDNPEPPDWVNGGNQP